MNLCVFGMMCAFQPNQFVFALLCAIAGMLLCAFCTLVGMLVTRAKANKRNAERYVYVRETVNKPSNCAKAIDKKSSSKKKRHGKR